MKKEVQALKLYPIPGGIEQQTLSQSTNVEEAMAALTGSLETNEVVLKAFILTADGMPRGRGHILHGVVANAEEMRDNGISIFTVGAANDESPPFVNAISSTNLFLPSSSIEKCTDAVDDVFCQCRW
ncbi:hypothetical protein NDN08_007703 [Rhodosorus marinus]|uniref:VWFA domain-containing protein n=1 Tax=Rhodosorus marinus TaxID=101924 RepID=A0AAV8UYB2_9RHOD|nr:hypothetical protein NDN08_007703 [Rhodosorus marinus]